MCRSLRYIVLAAIFPFSLLCTAQNNGDIIDSVFESLPPPPPVQEAYSPFAAVKKPEPVAIRKVPLEIVAELKEDDAYWYANLEPAGKKKAQLQQSPLKKRVVNEAWFQNLLWLLILFSFIGVVIWYLASSNISLFRKSSRKILNEPIEEELPDDIFSINYDREIDKAAEAKNYRLAVRLWYLNTLKELSERNIIDYRQEKTNSDYVTGLYGGRYYSDFFRLTRNFDYTWYGQFNLSAEAYEMMKVDFIKFKNGLS